MKETISSSLKEHSNAFAKIDVGQIEKAAKEVVKAYSRGNKLIAFGNGGSASDAEHFAAELVGRFMKERKALNAIALTGNSSSLTAISNDYGYENSFSRQIDAYAAKNDITFGISTSGNSKNVISALKKAKQKGCITIGLIGRDGGEQKKFCDYSIIIPHDEAARVQEMHILVIHILCEIIEDSL